MSAHPQPQQCERTDNRLTLWPSTRVCFELRYQPLRCLQVPVLTARQRQYQADIRPQGSPPCIPLYGIQLTGVLWLDYSGIQLSSGRTTIEAGLHRSWWRQLWDTRRHLEPCCTPGQTARCLGTPVQPGHPPGPAPLPQGCRQMNPIIGSAVPLAVRMSLLHACTPAIPHGAPCQTCASARMLFAFMRA